MGIVKQEDIRGYWIGERNKQLVCADCVKDDEIGDLTEDMILTSQEVEVGEDLCFCDRCHKQME